MRKRRAFRIYTATFSILLIAALFAYMAAVLYVDARQVAIGTDMSVLDARQEEDTLALELAGRRVVIDTGQIRDLEHRVATRYYAWLPDWARIGAPVADKLRAALHEAREAIQNWMQNRPA